MGEPKKKKRKLSAYNKHMSREMKKGRTFKQAVASWKPGSKKSSPKKKASKNTGGKTTMGKKGGFNMNKIYGLIRKGAIVLPAVGIAMEPISGAAKLEAGVRAYFGYSMKYKQFNWGWLAQGWTPFLASIGVTYGLPKLASIIRGI